MSFPSPDQVLSQEINIRSICAEVHPKSGFVRAANSEIPLSETNACLRVRLVPGQAAGFLKRAGAEGLSVVMDADSEPGDLDQQLVEAGFTSSGRAVLAVLNPALIIQPPGDQPTFTPVGPSELPRFIELITGLENAQEQGATARRIRALELLWSFRLRSLMVSSYVGGVQNKIQAGFALFHGGQLARLIGPFCGEAPLPFDVVCALVGLAWERAASKGAQWLYTFAMQKQLDFLKNAGFQEKPEVWLETWEKRDP